jgi:hypothetical protein
MHLLFLAALEGLIGAAAAAAVAGRAPHRHVAALDDAAGR